MVVVYSETVSTVLILFKNILWYVVKTAKWLSLEQKMNVP